jgi:integrase
MMSERWTDRAIEALPIPATGSKITYDSAAGADGAIAGFGIRVTAGKARSFILSYRLAGRERRLTIGSYPAWHGAAARKRAAELRQQIDRGEDPLAERDEERAGRTVAELWAAFEADHLPTRRPSTAAEYRREAVQHILPRLGRLKVSAVSREDIASLHREIAKAHPYMANRVLALLSVLFNLAVEREMRPDNPCARVPKAPEERRETFLSPAEIGRLADALAAHPEKVSAAAIRFLMLTGARRNEALAATWAEFDLQSAVWTKPSTNTKQKRSHRVPLSAAAVAVLADMQAEAEKMRRDGIITPYVFPSRLRSAKALREVRRTWSAVCKAAGLHGIRLHDLRHSFASALVSAGVGLPTIGAMLGHSQPRTTARYSHLYDTTLRDAAERVGSLVTGAGKTGADVVPIGGRRA